MKVCIVYEEDHLLLKQLRQALLRRSILTKMIGIDEVSLILNEGNLCSLQEFDLVYFDRATERLPYFATQIDIFTHLEKIGVSFVNSPMHWLKARNKVTMTTLLNQWGFKHPETWIGFSLEAAIEASSKWPVAICKPIFGFSGYGVIPFESHNPPTKLLEAELRKSGCLYIQEFIDNPNCVDLRVDVVGGSVAYAFRRIAAGNEKYPICNISQGARHEFVELAPEIETLVLNVTTAFGLDVAGIDLLYDGNKLPFVSEVNPEPNCTEWQPEFGEKIAQKFIDERRARK